MNKFIITLFLFYFSSAYTQWNQLTTGTTADLRSLFFLNPNTGYSCGASGTVIKTTNGGINWSSLNSGLSDNLNSIYFLTPQTGYACGNAGKIIYTSNGGLNWIAAQSSVTDNLFSIQGNFCTGSNGNLLVTTNGGINWQVSAGGFLSTYYGITSLSASTAAACGVNTIFQPLIARTTNGGINWSYSSFYLNGNEGNLRDIIYLNSSSMLAVSNVWDGTGGISFSSNSGVNWSTQLFSLPLNSIDMAGSFGFSAGLQGYVLKTTDQGISWQQSQTGLTVNFRCADIIDSLNAYICGDGGVIIKTTNGGITFIQPISNNTPEKFSLSQNYPNPFNPSTTIRFSIPLLRGVSGEAGRGMFTLLKIYDILGNEIETLVNQSIAPGTYSVEWNAANYPSGVYFYTLSSGDFRQTYKMVLIK